MVLQGAVGKALDAAGAENARGFFAPTVVTAHCSNGCGMRSLGLFAVVGDPAQFPPSPAQVATWSYTFDDEPWREPENCTDQQRPGPWNSRGASMEGDAKTREPRKQRPTEIHRHPRQRMCRSAGCWVGPCAQERHVPKDPTHPGRVPAGSSGAMYPVA
jgi:hypothetical protein